MRLSPAITSLLALFVVSNVLHGAALPPADELRWHFDELRRRWSPLDDGFRYGASSAHEDLAGISGTPGQGPLRLVRLDPKRVKTASLKVVSVGDNFEVEALRPDASVRRWRVTGRSVYHLEDGDPAMATSRVVQNRSYPQIEASIPPMFVPGHAMTSWFWIQGVDEPEKGATVTKAEVGPDRCEFTIAVTRAEPAGPKVYKRVYSFRDHGEAGWLPVEMVWYTAEMQVSVSVEVKWATIRRGSAVVPLPKEFRRRSFAADEVTGERAQTTEDHIVVDLTSVVFRADQPASPEWRRVGEPPARSGPPVSAAAGEQPPGQFPLWLFAA